MQHVREGKGKGEEGGGGGGGEDVQRPQEDLGEGHLDHLERSKDLESIFLISIRYSQ